MHPLTRFPKMKLLSQVYTNDRGFSYFILMCINFADGNTEAPTSSGAVHFDACEHVNLDIQFSQKGIIHTLFKLVC